MYLLRTLCWVFLLAAVLSSGCGPETASEPEFFVPVEYHTLQNGLKVVLSPDPTAPIVIVAVYYNIGFRNEPQDRTGFAHLFEHMMFQGSANLGKMEFIQLVQKNGGVLNGSTRYDFTNYFEILPSHKLETALWAEADRMKGLQITQENLTNQQGVVSNEVKVNVLNRPYGGFPWLDMPQIANQNWYNAHNFYGDLEDLEAATLEDVQNFFDVFYSPNNAALVVSGDFDPAAGLEMVKQYFSGIAAGNLPPAPDLTEPRQEEARLVSKVDKLANRPALAFAYHMPERNTPEYFAMGLIDQLLIQGDDSRLAKVLVRDKGYTGEVQGGINFALGNQFNYNGPMLWMGSLFHDSTVSSSQILDEINGVIEDLRTTPVTIEELNRAKVKLKSGFFSELESLFGFGKVDLLASFALFDNDPGRINSLEAAFQTVTPELVQKTASEYLRPDGQTVLTIEPGASPSQPTGGRQ